MLNSRGQLRRWFTRAVLLALVTPPITVVAREFQTLTGRVLDPHGLPVADAEIRALSPEQAPIASASSDRDGHFVVPGVVPGRLEIEVRATGFQTLRRVVRVSEAAPPIELTLSIDGLLAEVSVAAEPGLTTAAGEVAQRVSVIDHEDIANRGRATVAEVVQGEVGVQLQRTSPAIAGVFIRGLGGRNVSVFVDGVRYSTASDRGGINTFLGLIDPASLKAVEVLRGPQGAALGGSSLGGAMQLLSRTPRFATEGTAFHGGSAVTVESGDESMAVAESLGWSGERAAIAFDLQGQRHNPVRAGQGLDPHAAVTRFLGLPSSTFGGSRLPDTGFTTWSGFGRFDWAPTPGHGLTLSYRRGQVDGANRYDQLLGGEGEQIGAVRGLMLDLAALRWETTRMPTLDDVSLTLSFNRQREERVRQVGATSSIRHEGEATTVLGLQTRGRRSLGPHEFSFGGELYREEVSAATHSRSPLTGFTSIARPRIPDRANYDTTAAWAHGGFSLLPDRLRAQLTVRASHADYHARAADSPLVAGKPLWDDADFSATDFTWQLGVTAVIAPGLRLNLAAARGFHAPSATDLGSLGRSGSGFEVAPAAVISNGARVGSTSDALATAIAPVSELASESALTLETSVVIERGPVSFALGGFVNQIDGALEKRTLLLPNGAVGTTLGGEAIVRQLESGAVFVAAVSSPVLVRANVADIRFAGIEQSLEVALPLSLRFSQNFTWIHAEDKSTGLPPAISGGVPAVDATVRLRWQPRSRSWVEAVVRHNWNQSRLSSLALADHRIGAYRSRDDVAEFFRGGASDRGLIDSGPDGDLGTHDDLLQATGETLAEVQDRVLGEGVEGAALFATLPAWTTFDLQAGLALGDAHQLGVALINVFDHSYRGMAWGMPGSGRGVRLRYAYEF